MGKTLTNRTILVAVATETEASALRGPLRFSSAPSPWIRAETGSGCDLVLTGVGKANASGGVSRVLDPKRHIGVLNVGIAGALPGAPGGALEIGSSVLATRAVFADEGVQSPGGFETFAELGFPLAGSQDAVESSDDWVEALSGLVDASGPIATVSTCSGTDALAGIVQGRTGALAEACEGAACGLSALRLGVLFGELRVISNTTGDRGSQVWDMGRALQALETLIANADLFSRLVGARDTGDSD